MARSETFRRLAALAAGLVLLSLLVGCADSSPRPSLQDVQRVQIKLDRMLHAMETAPPSFYKNSDLQPLIRRIKAQIQARDLAAAEASIEEILARLERAAATAR